MQHDYILDDAKGGPFRADLNSALGAIKSRNSDPTSAPDNPVQGMVYVKTVSSTVHEVYEYDGSAWVRRYVINPTTHEVRSIDGVRRQWCGTATGSANALTLTSSPAITAYEDGQTFAFYTGAADNTGAMTANIDGQGSKTIQLDGADPAAGDVPANTLVIVRYRQNILHIVGGVVRKASTAAAGKVTLDNEAGFLAATAGKVPTSDVVKKHVREKLQADRTYYVRTDGSDANNGLANSSGGAWLTLQKAWNVISQTLDLNGYTVTVQVGDGTYTAGLSASGPVPGQKGTDNIRFQGNSSTPGNVVISVTSANAIVATARAAIRVTDMELRTTTAGNCLYANSSSAITFSNLRFGACAGRHIESRASSLIAPFGSYAIVGAASRHFFAVMNGSIQLDATLTITVTGTPAFSSMFARASNNGAIYCDSSQVTISGAATGKRYEPAINGSIDTEGGGANYFPGNVAGTTATGGQYA